VSDAPFEPRALQIGKSLQVGKQCRDARGFIAKTPIVQRVFQGIIHRH
jgi:hypothetical protein